MKRTIISLFLIFIVVFNFAACSAGQTDVEIETQQVESQTIATVAPTVVSTTSTSVTNSSIETTTLLEDLDTHEDAEDYSWDPADVVAIELNGNSISANSNGVLVEGSKATITSAGTYSFSGLLSDGQIIVNTQDKDVVRLILNGVDLRSSSSAPIYVLDAKKVVIVLAENSQNFVSDATYYTLADPNVNEPNAAIFSMSDLTIFGTGTLTVNGNYQDGISSKDGLILAGGNLVVTAIDDGIRGKDYLLVKDGNISVNAQGDALKSDNEEDTAKGYLYIENGTFNLVSGGDAINAQNNVSIVNGVFNITTGGGADAVVSADMSVKAIKGVGSVVIDGGTFMIDSADDALHSNGSIVVNGGLITISTGDDGMHADATLDINGGEILIKQSYEGIESAVITVNAGTIHINSSDDGLNVAAGNDGSGMAQSVNQPGGKPGRGGGPGQDTFANNGNNFLYINGGTIVVQADGDGVDVNGSITMTDGVVLVNGPLENMNGALDYDGTFNISGGIFVATGSSGMAMAPSNSSSQYSLLLNFNWQAAGTIVHIQNSTGEAILTFVPSKDYQSISFSSPDLANGETYSVFFGGSDSGSVVDGLYQGGVYSSGTQYTTFTISNVVTNLGGAGNRGGRP